MDWDPMSNWVSYDLEWNGDRRVRTYNYQCQNCDEITNEQHLDGVFIKEDYLCVRCIRKFFFERFDFYSIPWMDEVKGTLKYTGKALGTRLPIHRKMRDKVFKRDKYKCVFCGCDELGKLSVDHIHPYVHGGEDVFENFQTLCKSCNSKKGAKVGYVPERQK